MKIIVIAVGKTNTAYIADAVAEFSKRINHYAPMETVIIPDLKNTKGLTEEQQKQREGTSLLASLQPSDHVCLLDEKGQQLTSREFASLIDRRMSQGLKRLVFIIG
ncbi:MAG: 23S rRNA (pseudouridine(1915)-N(3))-methyltransferase RlmH, partial [Duncaniella sp.]|nr:23S rRNA (pseudouridine(1915)-N(3))-methyltransferase RlmH [Duncaniella sp.]